MTFGHKVLAVATVTALLAPEAHAADDVLVVIVGNDKFNYFAAYGARIGDSIGREITAGGDGGSATVFVLHPWAGPLPSLAPYEQVWVFDLSNEPDDHAILTSGFAAIADWWTARGTDSVIFDARILAGMWDTSFPLLGYPMFEGRPEDTLIGNYYRSLEASGGGLFLGTDDSTYHQGVNSVAQDIGFYGFAEDPTVAVQLVQVVPEAPFIQGSDPSRRASHHLSGGFGYLWANSGIGLAPSGPQPNGLVLEAAAHVTGHSDQVAISYHIVTDTCSPETCLPVDYCHVAECDEQDTCVQIPLDADVDGVPDCDDGCPFDPDKDDPGVCGCDESDADSDDDGVADCDDGCPSDSDKVEPGVCGCDESDADGDGDDVEDCIDNCPDTFNPGQADSDRDGIGNHCDGDSDADRDGVFDRVDMCPDTEFGAPTDPDGCSLDDTCPCDADWRHHGQYMVCVVRSVRVLVASHAVSRRQAGRMLGEAARSECPPDDGPWDGDDHEFPGHDGHHGGGHDDDDGCHGDHDGDDDDDHRAHAPFVLYLLGLPRPR